jgi:hypothetical protein
LKTIEITFLPNGQSRVETKGFVGGECRAASRFLEQAIGQATHEALKPEFHQAASSSMPLQQGQ